MANKIPVTAQQRTKLFIHLAVFIIVNLILWITYDKAPLRVDVNGWAYVWPIWITAAWGLSFIGHYASLYTNYEDEGIKEYQRQKNN